MNDGKANSKLQAKSSGEAPRTKPQYERGAITDADFWNWSLKFGVSLPRKRSGFALGSWVLEIL
jgi:hypothetical protein